MSKPDSAIINITSGLAFAPLARTPVCSATKAALHSFTLSLRHQLNDTPVKVIEIAPPAVDTDLGGPGLHTFGVNVDGVRRRDIRETRRRGSGNRLWVRRTRADRVARGARSAVGSDQHGAALSLSSA